MRFHILLSILAVFLIAAQASEDESLNLPLNERLLNNDQQPWSVDYYETSARTSKVNGAENDGRKGSKKKNGDRENSGSHYTPRGRYPKLEKQKSTEPVETKRVEAQFSTSGIETENFYQESELPETQQQPKQPPSGQSSGFLPLFVPSAESLTVTTGNIPERPAVSPGANPSTAANNGFNPVLGTNPNSVLVEQSVSDPVLPPVQSSTRVPASNQVFSNKPGAPPPSSAVATSTPHTSPISNSTSKPTSKPTSVPTKKPVSAPTTQLPLKQLSSAPPFETKPIFDLGQPVALTPTSSPTIPTKLQSSAASPALEQNLGDTEAEGRVSSTGDEVIHKALITAEPRTIRAQGIFDPEKSEGTVFFVMESSMKTYFNAYVGSLLESFDLSIKYFHEYDQIFTTQGSTMVITFFNVDVSFSLASDNMNDIADFSTEMATALVDQFFKGENLIRIIRRLNVSGVKIDSIEIVESLPSSTTTGNGTVADEQMADILTAKDGRSSGVVEDTSSSKPNVTFYAALASGFIIFLTIVSVILATKSGLKRKLSSSSTGGKRNSRIDTLSESSSGIFVDSDDRRPNSPLGAMPCIPSIPPAALSLRNEQHYKQATSRRPYSDAPTTPPSRKSLQQFLSESAIEPPSVHYNVDFDSCSVGRMEDGLVASAALTCLDPDNNDISTEYPEFNVYAHIPQEQLKPQSCPSSPAWSVGARSYDYPSTADDGGDYAQQRRRWHDQQADDLSTADDGGDYAQQIRRWHDQQVDDLSTAEDGRDYAPQRRRWHDQPADDLSTDDDEVYAQPRRRWPYQQTDNMSTGDDGGDYAQERRRWHDQQADDIGLVALPDHASEMGYSSEASTMTGANESESGTRTRDDSSATTIPVSIPRKRAMYSIL